MEDQKQTSFTFEIDNFTEKEGLIKSPIFLSGGCEWVVNVYPKGQRKDDHLSIYLRVANPESLRFGWKRRASYSLVLLNSSGKELYRNNASCQMFCAGFLGWGKRKAVPLKKLLGEGFLEKNKLVVKAVIKVVEVVDEGGATENGMLDVSGFQVLYSQARKVGLLFVDHPDIALNVRSKNQLVKTTYMNILLGLIETLNKPMHSITDTELENAQSELMELTESGFKLDWLKKKIEEISLDRKKAIPDPSQVRELEEHIKKLKAELNNEKCNSAAKFSSLEKMVSDLKAELDMEKVKTATYDAKFFSFEQNLVDIKTECQNSDYLLVD